MERSHPGVEIDFGTNHVIPQVRALNGRWINLNLQPPLNGGGVLMVFVAGNYLIRKTNQMTMSTLPPNFYSRPASMNDLESVAELINAWWLARTGDKRLDADELRTEWSRPYLELERDTLLIEAPDGELAGHATIFDGPPHVRAPVWSYVPPEYQGLGLESALEAWLDQRGELMLHKAPPGKRVVLVQERPSEDQAGCDHLVAHGYQAARHSLEMLIEMEATPPEPTLPPGVSVRPFVRGQEDRAVVETIRKAFMGHWGYVPMPFEEDLKEWSNFFYNAPNCDPELMLIAVEGVEPSGEIIGTCFNVPTPADRPGSAWIFALGVRPERRQRGLGLALLQHSLSELFRKGFTRVSLAVDAGNLTGATRLYEKAGFHLKRRFDVFERELRAGGE